MASTVLVELKKDWFGPSGSLYETEDNPHEFPAAWADKPERAENETDEEWKLREKHQPFAVLPSSAKVLGKDATTVAYVQNTGGGQQVIMATAVGDEVTAVGGALDDKGIEQPAQSVAAAEKGAEAQNLDVGGKPRESGPLPAGTKKSK